MGEPHYPVRLGRWRVAQRITKAEKAMGHVISACQKHGGVVVAADECVSGETGADGIVVRGRGQKVAVFTADCMPLVITTDKEAVVLHVSRKSLIHGLLDKIEDVMDPRLVTGVYVGPHICPHHFAFEWLGEELRQFQMLFPCAMSWQEPWEVSLRSAVQSYLDQWGLDYSAITIDDRCTYDCAELPSYRRYLVEGVDPNAVRLATVVWRE